MEYFAGHFDTPSKCCSVLMCAAGAGAGVIQPYSHDLARIVSASAAQARGAAREPSCGGPFESTHAI
jgi:hypothetical protein